MLHLPLHVSSKIKGKSATLFLTGFKDSRYWKKPLMVTPACLPEAQPSLASPRGTVGSAGPEHPLWNPSCPNLVGQAFSP